MELDFLVLSVNCTLLSYHNIFYLQVSDSCVTFNISYRYKIQVFVCTYTCTLMYKVFHKLVPLILQNKFSMSSSKKYKSNFRH